jgi:cytochrome c oxidase subunit 2
MKHVHLLSALLLAACTSSTSAPTTSNNPTTSSADRIASIAKLTGNTAAGKTVYETSSAPKCAACHGADGKGNDAKKFPELAEPSQNDDVAELAEAIVNGKGKMPAQKSLTDQQIADVVAYMKATFGK